MHFDLLYFDVGNVSYTKYFVIDKCSNDVDDFYFHGEKMLFHKNNFRTLILKSCQKFKKQNRNNITFRDVEY